MARRKLTVDRHEEIKRRLADGRSLREIATALGCSRRLVRQIRDGERLTHETAASPDPLWMAQLEWRKCFWHDFFVAIGHLELTTVLCEFDRNWFDVISPERHGFRFERKTTLGYGGTHCPFHFLRVPLAKA
jgi:hypothetical protein